MALRWRRVLVSGLGLAVVSFAGSAKAAGSHPDKMECITADTDGQSSRLAGRFREARTHFAVCASSACPAVVREDCLQRIDELDGAQPTVVFGATNGDGRALVAVQVFMDGELLTGRLDGQPLGVDVGEHNFTFKALGRLGTEMRLVFHEGDRARHGVVLRTDAAGLFTVPPSRPDPTRAVEQPARQTATPQAVTNSSGVPADTRGSPSAAPAPTTTALDWTGRSIALGTIAFGVLEIAVGTVFGTLTIINWNAARSACPSGCAADSHARQEQIQASTDGTMATIGFVAGGVALGAGAVLWFASPDPTKPQAMLSVSPGTGLTRGQLRLQGTF